MKKIFIQLQEFLKYSIWGLVSTVINLFLFVIFEQIGINYIIANSLAYAIAVFINYFLNNKFVFAETSIKGETIEFKNLIKFLGIKGGYLIFDSTLFYIMVTVLQYNLYVSRILVTGFGLLVTYKLAKKFVFKNERGTQ